MHVRTFRAANSQAALAMVKDQLGAEAIILDTKNVVEDGRRVTEVTAALDNNAPARGSQRRGPAACGGNGSASARDSGGEARWQREWSDIKDCLLTLMGGRIDKERLPSRQRQALEHLEREGVGQTIVLKLFSRLTADPQASVLGVLGEVLDVEPLDFGPRAVKTHVLAGPYGAGKTTTAIRMALAAQEQHPGARVCLANTDTQQARGRLILKHYAELSGFAYRELRGPADTAQLAAESGEFDYVIVDTPGLPAELKLSDMLARCGMDALDGRTCHLVLSPLYAEPQLEAFLDAYLCEDVESLIWTKLDEARAFGTILNVAEASGLPVAAMAWGPGVSECMAPARSMQIWKLIFKHQLPGGGTQCKEGRTA